MGTQSVQIGDLNDQIRNFFLKSAQSPDTNIQIMENEDLIAVFIQKQSLQQLQSIANPAQASPTSSLLDQIIHKFKTVNDHYQEMERAYTHLLLTASSAIVPQQSYVYGHNERIAIFSTEIARESGCSEEEIKDIEMAALLHDIGEIIIPSYLLQKSTNLTSEEWDIIKDHPRVGAEYVAKVGNLSKVAEIVLAHHERYDGSGYPNNLKGESIPLGARIISIVDTYDAMTNCRLHRVPKTHLEAISELNALSGLHYDPALVERFVQSF